MIKSDAMSRYAGSLSGRVGLVTGAGSGIGREVAVALARAGADVALVGRRPDALGGSASLVESTGRRALPCSADVADPAAIQAVVTRTGAVLGAPDVVVTAAGVNAWGEIEDLDPVALRSALATNVEGVANVARAVIPEMRNRGSGKIIVIASDVGRRAEAGGSGYVASKFGAVGLALSLSAELYAAGIGVHVIEPGCVDTDWYGAGEQAPRDRMLKAEDIALAAIFLATLPDHIVLEELMLLPRGLLVTPWA